MTLLQRLGAEILAGWLALGIFLGWWQMHDHAEQKLGATACIQSTTESKQATVADDASVQTAQAAQLTQVVAIYDQKLKISAGDNADLAQRLHDYALRESTGSRSGSAACTAAPDRGLSKSESAAQKRLGRVRADLKFVLDACDANDDKLAGAVSAYDDWRQRMIEKNAKP